MFCSGKKRCCIGALAPIRAEPEWTQPVGHRDGQLYTASSGGGGSTGILKIGGLKLRLDDQISINQPVVIPIKFRALWDDETFDSLTIGTDHKLYYGTTEVADPRGFYNTDDCNISCTEDSEADIKHLLFLVQHSTVVQYFA